VKTNELENQLMNEIKAILHDPDARHAVAEKIVKYVSDGISQTDLASLILPKETIPVGTTAEYAIRGKLKAYWHEPGSYAPRTAMVQKVFTVPTWMISAHPEYEISQLEAGRYGTIQDQISAAKEAIQGAINARIFNTVVGSIATTDTNYGTCITNLTKNALDKGLNWCEDQVGGAVAIVGRRNLLYSMLDFGTTGSADTGIFSDSMKDQVLKGGNFPSYRGVPIISLPQWRDGFGRLTIPQDTVMIIGQDVGRYVVSKELDSKDTIDVDTLIWHIHLYMKVGCAVFFPERMYKIVVNRA
jgi:hypothetical protein